MSKYLSDKFSKLSPYVPGEQPKDKKYVKLNTNENPYPPCPDAYKIMCDDECSDLKLYSDPENKDLSVALSSLYGINPDNVIFGNGSDEILSFAFSAYCDEKTPAVFADITYGLYKVLANLNNVKYTEIPLTDEYTINISDYFNAKGTIFLANPNAPTGIALTISDVEKILINNKDNVVVVDEAYVDFGCSSCVDLINKYDNLLVVQTCSKSRSLAGARLGFGIASKEIISDLQTIRNSGNPYNINRLTQKIGVAAFNDKEYFAKCNNAIVENRKYLTTELQNRGFIVLPSSTNFVFAKSDKISGNDLYLKLKDSGVLVRHFKDERIKDFNRITIGTKEQIDILLSAIDKII